MFDPDTGIWTVPYTGRYIFRFTTPPTSGGTEENVLYQVGNPEGGITNWNRYYYLPGGLTQTTMQSFVWSAGDQRIVRIYPDTGAINTFERAELMIEFVQYEAGA